MSIKRTAALKLLNTPRGSYILAHALHLALAHMDTLPPHRREPSNALDMRLLLEGMWPDYAALFELEDAMRQRLDPSQRRSNT